jgi:hypothetical protein
MEKKPYASPTLTVLGRVADLTRGGGSIPNPDGRSGMAML